ncbi:Mariner Mos1 transposase [Eumeta japonica]|uniref:Mariner Mos1 transposase n=1 Tax=Eumeta variegata TaxID=151549 RepID=A0A4C1ZJ81_EUMVA|nr:Mariner Mos1 transposase [Eumeta japonica]
MAYPMELGKSRSPELSLTKRKATAEAATPHVRALTGVTGRVGPYSCRSKVGHTSVLPAHNPRRTSEISRRDVCVLFILTFLRRPLARQVFEEVKKNKRQRRIILHYDIHTSAETTRFLEGQKIDLTGHPPYSPDLTPNDFYLFSSVKNNLHDQRFSSLEEAVQTFKMHILEILQ